MLIVLERKLDVVTGHFQSQIAAMDALSGGREMQILSSLPGKITNRVRVLEDQRITRIFQPFYLRQEDSAGMLVKDIDALGDYFMTCAEGASLLVPTATYYEFRLVLGALAKARAPGSISMRLLEERQFTLLDDHEQTTLRDHAKSGRVTVVTETSSLSDLMQARHDLPTQPRFVLPCMILPGQTLPKPVTRTGLRVGFMGNARREKGWHDLYKIIGALAMGLGETKLPGPVEFLVPRRSNSRFRPSNLFRGARVMFEARKGRNKDRPNIRVIRTAHFVPDDEFVDLIQSLDVVIIPYRVKNYANRGSGIILDAVLAKKPIIHTDGIGMAEYLCFGNGAPATTPDEFAEQIIKVLQNPESYKAGCEKAHAFALTKFEETASYLKDL